MKEKEKQKGVGTMKSGRTGDSRVVGNSLMGVVGDATWKHGGVLACSATEAMSKSMALHQ